MSAAKKNRPPPPGRAPKSTDQDIVAYIDQRYRQTGHEPSLTDIQAKFGGGTSRIVRLRRQWRARRESSTSPDDPDPRKLLAPLAREVEGQRASLVDLQKDIAHLRDVLAKRTDAQSAERDAPRKEAAEPPLTAGVRALAEMIGIRLATSEQIQTLLLLLLGRMLDRELVPPNLVTGRRQRVVRMARTLRGGNSRARRTR